VKTVSRGFFQGYWRAVRKFLLLALSPLLLANAAPIPVPVKAMLDAAIASGTEPEVTTVAKFARAAAPDSAAAIDALLDGWRRAVTAKHAAAVAAKADRWDGKVELGGFMTTGNSHDVGASGAIDVKRETRRWRHKLHLAVDYQRSAGVVSREHYLAGYEPNFKFSPRGYVYGSAQFESDHYLGYDERYSASLGAGYSAISRPGLKLDVELGPAFRQTSFSDHSNEGSAAARGSINLDWKLSKAVSLTQATSAYVEHYNSTVSSKTALNAKLLGPLAAQLSYGVQYESMPPVGGVTTDTTSRASLVYSF
jgi:putative salt-induced outer membrane protein